MKSPRAPSRAAPPAARARISPAAGRSASSSSALTVRALLSQATATKVTAMPFERLPTRIEDVALIQPAVHADERGFFAETFRRDAFAELGIEEEMVQDNHSRSKLGIVRGLHFQIGDGAAKLVRCGRGTIVDVVVDLRRGSPTFGEWEGFELSDENGRMVYCPIGFAHGFCVVSDLADVFYKQSHYYSDEHERG